MPNGVNSKAIVMSMDFIGQFFWDKYQSQPWYRKIANTVTATVGVVSVIISQAAVMGMDLPKWAQFAVLVLFGLATVFGVYKTKNGLSASQLESIEREAERFLNERTEAMHDPGHEHAEPEKAPSHQLTVDEIATRLSDEMRDRITKAALDRIKSL